MAARLGRGRKHGLLPKCILHWVMLSIVRFGLKEKDKLLKIIITYSFIYSFEDCLLKQRHMNHMLNQYYLIISKWESGNL